MRTAALSTQLGKFFGIKLEQQDFLPVLGELASRIGETHMLTLWLGLGFLGLLVVAHYWVPKLPDALARLIEELRHRGIAFKIARANRPLRERLAHIGLGEHLDKTTLFPSVHAAIAAYRQRFGTRSDTE